MVVMMMIGHKGAKAFLHSDLFLGDRFIEIPRRTYLALTDKRPVRRVRNALCAILILDGSGPSSSDLSKEILCKHCCSW